MTDTQKLPVRYEHEAKVAEIMTLIWRIGRLLDEMPDDLTRRAKGNVPGSRTALLELRDEILHMDVLARWPAPANSPEPPKAS